MGTGHDNRRSGAPDGEQSGGDAPGAEGERRPVEDALRAAGHDTLSQASLRVLL